MNKTKPKRSLRKDWRGLLQLFLVFLIMGGLTACTDPQLKKDREWVKNQAELWEKYRTEDPLLGLRAEAMDERLGTRSLKRANEISKVMLELGHSPLAGFESHERLREDYAQFHQEEEHEGRVLRYYLQSQAPAFLAVQELSDLETPTLRSAETWTPLDGSKHQVGGLAIVEEKLLLSDLEKARLYLYDQEGKRLEEFGRDLEEEEVESFEEALGKPAVFHAPLAMAFHPESERLYVIDAGGNHLMVLDRKGNLLERYPLPTAAGTHMDLAVSKEGVLYLSLKGVFFPTPGLYYLEAKKGFRPILRMSCQVFSHQGEIYAAQVEEMIELYWPKRAERSEINKVTTTALYSYLFQIKDQKAYIADAFPIEMGVDACVSLGDQLLCLNGIGQLECLAIDGGVFKGAGDFAAALRFERKAKANYVFAATDKRLFILDRSLGSIKELVWE